MAINLPAIPKPSEVLRTDDSTAFTDRSDLTYRRFNSLTLTGVSAIQSLLTGSVFLSTTITSCNFSRADLEGAQIVQTTVTETTFANCDIRSCRFSNTKFIRCNFTNALLSYCEFDGCEFRDCDFGQATLADIKAQDSKFIDCRNEMATITQGEFVRCHFSNMKFADCTFLLHIFHECTFTECGINIDALGAVYGITENDIETFKLFYLGKEQPAPDVPSLIATLFGEFSRRHWHSKLVLLAWNMGEISTVTAIRSLMAMFKSHIDEGILLQSEELRFIRRISEHLTKTGRMPLVAATEGYEQTARLAMMTAAVGGHLHAEMSLLAMVFLQSAEGMQSELQCLTKDFEQLSDNYADTVITIRFDERPKVSTADLINAFASTFGFPPHARLLKSAPGSHIEWVQTTVAGLLAFRLILFSINGCLKEAHSVVENLQRFSLGRPKAKPRRQVVRGTKAANKIVASVQSNPILSDAVLVDFESTSIQDCSSVTEATEGDAEPVSRPREKTRRRAPS